MNVVNRVLVVILLLVAIVLCSILLAMPVRVLDTIAQQSAVLVDVLREYERYSVEWFLRVGLGVLFAATLDIVLVLLIILEVRRPTLKAIRVEKVGGGEVQVSIASIADRLKYEIDQLSGVLRSKPKVSARRGGVVVELDVETAAGIDVPMKAEQIVETARRVVEEKMGLKLHRSPKVNLRARPYSKTQPDAASGEFPAKPEEVSFAAPEEVTFVAPEEAPPALPEGQSDLS